MAFAKRTLARCRKFEDTGSSCFSEPALQDVLFSAPPCSNDAKSADCVGSGTASNTCNEVSNHQTEAKGSGMLNAKKSFMMCIWCPWMLLYLYFNLYEGCAPGNFMDLKSISSLSQGELHWEKKILSDHIYASSLMFILHHVVFFYCCRCCLQHF